MDVKIYYKAVTEFILKHCKNNQIIELQTVFDDFIFSFVSSYALKCFSHRPISHPSKSWSFYKAVLSVAFGVKCSEGSLFLCDVCSHILIDRYDPNSIDHDKSTVPNRIRIAA